METEEIKQEEFMTAEKLELARSIVNSSSNRPKFTGKLDVAVWINKTKDGKEYANIKIGDSIRIPCWLNESEVK